MCISPLGLESGEIKDEALSHSLPSGDLSKPSFIRLNGDVPGGFPFGWRPRSAQTPPDYLQVTRFTIYFVIGHNCAVFFEVEKNRRDICLHFFIFALTKGERS